MTQPQYLPPNGGSLARFKPYVRILVETLPSVRVGVGGHSFTGAAIVDVPADELPKIQDKVRDPSAWAAAERQAERKRETERQAGRRYQHISAASVYFDLYGKGGGSLARVEVVEENVPPPLSDDEQKLATMMTTVQKQIARTAATDDDSDESTDEAPVRRRGRPRKSDD